MVRAARPNCELADAVGRVCTRARILRGKTLIDMVMSVQDDISMRCVKQIPKSLRIGRLPSAGAKQGDMPVRQGALVRVSCQVSLQKFILRRTGSATTDVGAI
jgi:hypothetical protein